MKKRKGIFSIVAEHVCNQEWFVTRIMGMCCIVRAEHLVMYNRVEYHAYSNLFDEVAEGEVVPYYEIQFSDDGSIKAVKGNNSF